MVKIWKLMPDRCVVHILRLDSEMVQMWLSN
jgi:hypothetical protein